MPNCIILPNIYNTIAVINGNKIDRKYIKSLNLDQRKELVEPLFNYFRDSGWQYPEFSNETLHREFKAIIKTNLNGDDGLNNNSSIGLKIGKHFCRSFFSATRVREKSPLEVWNDDNLLKKMIANRLGIFWFHQRPEEVYEMCHRNLINAMRISRTSAFISVFKPAIARYICEKYSSLGDTVGDYSCGFGARMLGAMACGRKYIGTDPLTVPELENMKNFFGFKDCKLIQSGSEFYRGEENSIDLYWSSPPYYNTEIYSNDLTQAYIKGEDYFYNTYWKKTLENVKFMLKPGKWFGLNINDQPRMLEMAKEVFGDVVEVVKMSMRRPPTETKDEEKRLVKKIENIYMFKNNK